MLYSIQLDEDGLEMTGEILMTLKTTRTMKVIQSFLRQGSPLLPKPEYTSDESHGPVPMPGFQGRPVRLHKPADKAKVLLNVL